MTNRILKWAMIVVIIVTIFGCTPSPKSGIPLPSRPTELRYLGEISGKLGSHSLSSPQSIAFDPQNNIYIVDAGNNRVIKLSSTHSFVQENGGYGLGLNELSHPREIVADNGISFFILDQGNNRIVRSDYNLVFSDELRFNSNPDLQTLGKIVSIGYSLNGRMYLVDPDNLKVIALDKSYAKEQELFPAGGFHHCTSVCVSDDGAIYVYDSQDKTIYQFDTFGNAGGEINLTDLSTLGGFFVHKGRIYATDNGKNEIAIFDLKGARLASVTPPSGTTAAQSSLSGINLQGENRLFVCDAGNNRILMYEVAAK